MNQSSLLLRYKKPTVQDSSGMDTSVQYQIQMGLWTGKNDEPLIQEIIIKDSNEAHGISIVTATREGIDRSERTNDQSNLLFQSIVTFTRESIDRSETTK